MINYSDIRVKEENDLGKFTTKIKCAVLLRNETDLDNSLLVQDVTAKSIVTDALKKNILNYVYGEIFINYDTVIKQTLDILIESHTSNEVIMQVNELMVDFLKVMKKRIKEPKENQNGENEERAEEKYQK